MGPIPDIIPLRAAVSTEEIPSAQPDIPSADKTGPTSDQPAATQPAMPADRPMFTIPYLQGLTQRMSHQEAQFAKLLQQLKPWVRSVVTDAEERLSTAYREADSQIEHRLGLRIDAFETRVMQLFRDSQVPDLSEVRAEIAQLRSDIFTPSAQAAYSQPAHDTSFDLFDGAAVPPPAPGKRPRETDTEDLQQRRARRRERQELREAQQASMIDARLRQERGMQNSRGAGSSSSSRVPEEITRDPPGDAAE